MGRGCWRRTEDKCDWLNGKGKPRPWEQLRHHPGATPSAWTRCSAANTVTDSFSLLHRTQVITVWFDCIQFLLFFILYTCNSQCNDFTLKCTRQSRALALIPICSCTFQTSHRATWQNHVIVTVNSTPPQLFVLSFSLEICSLMF